MEKVFSLIVIVLCTVVCAQFSVSVDGQAGAESGLRDMAGMEDNNDLVLTPSIEPAYGFKMFGEETRLGGLGVVDHYVSNGITDLILQVNGKLIHKLNAGKIQEGVSVSRITQSGIDSEEPAKYLMYTGDAEYIQKMKNKFSIKYSLSLADDQNSSRIDLKNTIRPSFVLKKYSLIYPGISIPVSFNSSSEQSFSYLSYGLNLMINGMVNMDTFYSILFNYSNRFYPKEKKISFVPGNPLKNKAGEYPQMRLFFVNFNISRELSPKLELYLDYLFYANYNNFGGQSLFSNKIGAGFTWVH